MGPCEFSQLLAVLHALEPARCLEWGSGGSTKAVLERCGFIERWVSVEHDPAWYERVRDRTSDPRLMLQLVEPDIARPDPEDLEAVMAWDDRAEQEPEMTASYVSHPESLGTEFDFVLVDGRARRLCLRAGYALLRPGGVAVLHDAQREEYHDMLHELGSPVFLEPYEEGQICLLRKPLDGVAGA